MTMTVYALAQISITDREAYDRYQARFMEVFMKFNGRLLAADSAHAWWKAPGRETK
jgi:uncharacterized protein (DUF1330 family)